jgi:hypothetical protein
VRFGPLHYARTTVAVALGGYRSILPHLRVEAHGRRADAVTAIVQIHDSWTYFGPLKVGLVPDPLPGITVLIAERLGALRTARLVARAAGRRDLERVPGLQVWQGVERVCIAADPPAWAQADGELLGRVDEVVVSRGTDVVPVLVPSR